jgi:hypothetical protein
LLACGNSAPVEVARLDPKFALPHIDRQKTKIAKVSHMRTTLALVLVLYSATALAQGSPPTVGEKPLVQVKPGKEAAKAKPKSIAGKLLACLEIDDGTKGRLDCYDAIFPPKPNPKAPAAKGVADCRFTKEEDERLTCFNGFAEKIPKF